MSNQIKTKNKPYKIAFFGTPGFTVDFLGLLYNLKNEEGKNLFDIKYIITGEDKPVGRGMQIQSPAPFSWGEGLGMRVLQPKKLDEEFYNILETEHEKENFDLFIVIAYGKIIPEKIINMPKFGTINLHYSLLPKYRGATPVESAILNGDTETGITIQQMAFELDSGDILFQEKKNILDTDTTTDLRNKLNKRALEIFPEFLKYFLCTPLDEGSGVRRTKQDHSQATFCKKIKKEDLDVSSISNDTNLTKEEKLKQIYIKWKTYNKKIFFFHTKQNGKKIRVKITEMQRNIKKDTETDEVQILKLLPESKKEINLFDFENNYGKINMN